MVVESERVSSETSERPQTHCAPSTGQTHHSSLVRAADTRPDAPFGLRTKRKAKQKERSESIAVNFAFNVAQLSAHSVYMSVILAL